MSAIRSQPHGKQKKSFGRNYLLITPIRNELNNLSELVNMVIDQTIPPTIWVIVDGNSNDGSYELAKNYTRSYDWIYVIKQEKFYGQGYSHQNFALAVNEGCRYGLDMADDQESIRLIGKIDATVVFKNDFFEKLIQCIESDEKLAFVCGSEQEINLPSMPGRIIISDPYVNSNDIRLYRRNFLEPLGFYPITFSPDVVLIIKARSQELNEEVCIKATFFDKRPGGTKIGLWKGHILKGKSMWGLGYNPIMILVNVLYYGFLRKPYYHSIAILFGYVGGFINKDERILDQQVVDYFWKSRLRDALTHRLRR